LIVAVSVSRSLGGGLESPSVSGEKLTRPQHRPIDDAVADEFAHAILHLTAEPVDALFTLAEVLHAGLLKPTASLLCLLVAKLVWASLVFGCCQEIENLGLGPEDVI
jgi:hypothetical protein